ncbi:hypothetical protein NPIL_395081 [Nephila pilipes]|uniref:Uncharacterized protein n=1 Tax=Nephila pilipes TaxID=299642 RepID=A0A8X6T6Y0_NEPPI|nr:hypothetical protein NPIL_521751 [Nephila pilipes]GFT93420.1 hypothetical protein NPIL_395081 [Nephila pilipes]
MEQFRLTPFIINTDLVLRTLTRFVEVWVRRVAGIKYHPRYLNNIRIFVASGTAVSSQDEVNEQKNQTKTYQNYKHLLTAVRNGVRTLALVREPELKSGPLRPVIHSNTC